MNWSSGEVELLTEAREWPSAEDPRRAGVSAFGVSGTNAHVIIEQAPAAPEPDRPERVTTRRWPGATRGARISARTPDALRAQAARLADFVTWQTRPLADGSEGGLAGTTQPWPRWRHRWSDPGAARRAGRGRGVQP